MEVNYRALTKTQVVFLTESKIKEERSNTAEVVRLFQEIYDRQIYLEYGFASLFDMATRYFGYCAGSAQRRINSMKLVKAFPEVQEKIESGELSLSAASNVQTFLLAEKKANKSYSKEEKLEVVQACLSKSTREVERELAKRNPEILQKESIKPVGEDRFQITLSISKELEAKLQKLKELLSHSNPNMKTEALLDNLAELGLDKYDPARKIERSEVRKQKKILTEPVSSVAPKIAEKKAVHSSFPAREVKSGYVSAQVKAQVMRTRDEGCCYVSPITGRRCGARAFPQADHIQPKSCGGSNEIGNLRLLCAQHNRFAWKNRVNERKRGFVRAPVVIYH